MVVVRCRWVLEGRAQATKLAEWRFRRGEWTAPSGPVDSRVGRDGLQPAAELGHLPRHEHGQHVLRALLSAPCATQPGSIPLSPARCTCTPRSRAASRLPARSPPHTVCPACDPRHERATAFNQPLKLGHLPRHEHGRHVFRDIPCAALRALCHPAWQYPPFPCTLHVHAALARRLPRILQISTTLTVGAKTHEYCELFMIIRSLSIQSHDSLGSPALALAHYPFVVRSNSTHRIHAERWLRVGYRVRVRFSA